jgi:hypothetical protein
MIYSDDDELPDYGRRDDPGERGDRPRRGLLIWPWLVVVGLAAIAIGVIGPLIR